MPDEVISLLENKKVNAKYFKLVFELKLHEGVYELLDGFLLVVRRYSDCYHLLFLEVIIGLRSIKNGSAGFAIIFVFPGRGFS